MHDVKKYWMRATSVGFALLVLLSSIYMEVNVQRIGRATLMVLFYVGPLDYLDGYWDLLLALVATSIHVCQLPLIMNHLLFLLPIHHATLQPSQLEVLVLRRAYGPCRHLSGGIMDARRNLLAF